MDQESLAQIRQIVTEAAQGLRQEMQEGLTGLRQDVQEGQTGLCQGMQEGLTDLRQEITTSGNSLREEMQSGLAGLRNEMVSTADELRDQMLASASETTRHAGMLYEDLQHKLELVIEGQQGIRQEVKEVSEKVEHESRDIRALLRASYQELHQRVENLEQRTWPSKHYLRPVSVSRFFPSFVRRGEGR